MPENKLLDAPVNVRIKLVGLWLAVTTCYLYGDYFELYTPGKVERLLNGQAILDSPTALVAAAAIMSLPAICVALSVFARPMIARPVNLIAGTLFTAMMIIIGLGSLVEWYAFYVLLACIESVLSGLIVFTAWRWPRGLAEA